MFKMLYDAALLRKTVDNLAKKHWSDANMMNMVKHLAKTLDA